MDRGGKVLRIDWMERDKVCQRMELHGQEVHPLTETMLYLQPIVITEKIIKHLDFEEVDIEEEGRFFKGKSKIWFIRIIDDIICCSKDITAFCDESNTYSIVGDLKYVHQLQNLYYALTGEELELKSIQPETSNP